MTRVGVLPRLNPFSTRFVQPGAIPFRFPTPEGLAALVRKLEASGGWGQLLGPHGSGKSTLLAALVPALAAWRVRVVRLNTTERVLPRWVWEGEAPAEPKVSGSAGASPSRLHPADSLLVIDGFEQLGWLTRWRVKRHCRRSGSGLLVTAHRSMGLPDLFRTDVNTATAAAVVAALIPPGAEWVLNGFDVAARLRHHHGSLREVLFELYDRWSLVTGH